MISTNYAGSCYQGYRVIFTSCTFCERNTLLISSGSLFLFMFTTPSLSWTEWQLCEMCNNSSDVHFALNCYKHHTQLVVRTPNVIAQKTLRCKGVTQGDSITMVVYGLVPPTLIHQLQWALPGVHQPWQDNYSAISRWFDCIHTFLEHLSSQVP